MGTESKAAQRLSKLFDNGIYTELDSKATNSVITAVGKIYGVQCYAFSQNSEHDDAAMTKAQAKKITHLYALAESTGCPIIGVYDSLGGKVSEGLGALCGYSDLISYANRLSGVVPQIAVVAGTCAASAAVWALNNDIVIMTEDAELFVNAPSLTDKKVGTTYNAVNNGTAHLLADGDDDAITKARDLITLLPANNLCSGIVTEGVKSGVEFTNDVISSLADADSVVELRKGFGTDCVTALAKLNGSSVGIVKAKGTVTDNDCKKIISLVGICDAFSIPVITFVDVDGFDNTADSEFNGMVKSLSALTKIYAEATTVKVTVINGKCFGVSYLAFAGNADMTFALNDAQVAAMSPDTAAIIVNKDKVLADGLDAATEEYDASALTAAKDGFIDDVLGYDEVVDCVNNAIDILADKRVSTLDKKHTVQSF